MVTINCVSVWPNLRIFESGELVEPSVVSILETTDADGKAYSVAYYTSMV